MIAKLLDKSALVTRGSQIDPIAQVAIERGKT
jgi:IMP cyclohydrolase